MKKEFITVSQNSGQGNASVSITADPHPFANDRSTSLLVRTAGDKSQEVRILQNSRLNTKLKVCAFQSEKRDSLKRETVSFLFF